MKNTPLTSIKVPDSTFQKLQEATKKSGLSSADVRRIALRIGLDALAKINYDVDGFLSDGLAEKSHLSSLSDSANEKKQRQA